MPVRTKYKEQWFYVVDGNGDRTGATYRGIGVLVVPEVMVSLEQRDHDARGTAVQGGVDFVIRQPEQPPQHACGQRLSIGPAHLVIPGASTR